MSSRPIYGLTTTPKPCIIEKIDNSHLEYTTQLFNILNQLNTTKRKLITIQQLQLLIQEINLKQHNS